MAKTMDLQTVTPDMVLKVYSGKPGCMCGCNGTYWYNPKRQDEGSLDRGYKVDADECNAAQVLRVLRLVQSVGDAAEFDDDGRCFYATIGQRYYVMYLRKEVVQKTRCAYCKHEHCVSGTRALGYCEYCATCEKSLKNDPWLR